MWLEMLRLSWKVGVDLLAWERGQLGLGKFNIEE